MRKLIVPILLLISSCKHVEIIHLAADFQSPQTQFYSFENDSVRLAYDFWADRGVMSFKFENKTGVPLYIDWSKSSFIRGSNRFNYYTDEVKTRTRSKGVAGYDGYGRAASAAVSASTAIHSERVSFVPPHSMIDGRFAPLTDAPYFIAPDGALAPDEMRKHVSKMKLTKGQQDFYYRNFITYCTNENFDRPQYADNAFYGDLMSVVRKQWFERHHNEDPTAFYLIQQGQ